MVQHLILWSYRPEGRDDMARAEDLETLAKEIQSAILAAFTHARVVQPEDLKKARIIHREDAVQEVMDPTKVQTR